MSVDLSPSCFWKNMVFTSLECVCTYVCMCECVDAQVDSV